MSNSKLSDAFQSSTAGIEHVTVPMSLPYDRLVSAFEAELGHLDSGKDGAVISYDRPSSFLAALGRPELKEFGNLLDQKIEGLIGALRKKT